ncbi:MAG: pseudouridine synthase [Candidatus Izemoplasmatales bacterium]|jgi:pseudouridine synthase|nr:pseudouridine synthase [Candidatus Izemoplasmatales bacterium]
MRINVFISSTGFCSRREADRLVQNGRVTIDNQIASIGMDVSDTNIVKIDGKVIGKQPDRVYIAFNKPRGIVSTTDQTKPNNIISYLNYPERIFPIGRLDKDTSGLILLTNDGMIVNKILRSENNHDKEYIVEVDKPISQDFINKMQTGVEIYNPVQHVVVETKPAKIKKINNSTFNLIITQGLNLQIRRMCKQLGYNVKTLKRIRIINIKINDLKIGQWRYLTEKEIVELLKIIEE